MRHNLLPTLALAALLSAPAGAAPLPDPAAVGWLGYAAAPRPGAGSCSGVLVAADLVVTAAHCLTSATTGAPADPAHLTFAAGWRQGRAAATARGAEVILPAARVLLDGRLPYDLALLRLAAPITGVTPLALATDPPPPDTPLTLLGYSQTAPDTAQREDGCRATLQAPPVIGLDCHAQGGFSGGAVLIATDGTFRLQAVMVAEARKTPGLGALALALPPDLIARLPAP